VHQQDAYTTNAGEGAVTIRFNTLAPLFNMLIVCLNLAYSKLLKLTAVANAGGV